MRLHKSIERFKEGLNRFVETVRKPSQCLFCQGRRIYWNGYRERTASLLMGKEVVYFTDILCRRVKCGDPGCGKSWTIRPLGIVPRRHYQLCVVGSAVRQCLFQPRTTLTSVAKAHQCSRRTMGRWLGWVGGLARPSALLHRLFSTSLPAVFDPRSIFRQAAGKTRVVFCLLEALGKAQGFSPPFFGKLIEAVISNRDGIATYRCPLIPELAR